MRNEGDQDEGEVVEADEAERREDLRDLGSITYAMRPDTSPEIVRSAKEATITKDQRTPTTPQERSYTAKAC